MGRPFPGIQRDSDDRDLRNLAEMLQGVLRRQGMLGQDMPIWGNDMNGKPLAPKVLDGKVVLLDFGATWCGPCIAEFPHLKKLYAQYRERGFEIVGYCVDSDVETMAAYLQWNPLTWPVLAKETRRGGHCCPHVTEQSGCRSSCCVTATAKPHCWTPVAKN